MVIFLKKFFSHAIYRNYDVAALTNDQNDRPPPPQVIRDCLRFLQSEMMFLTLSNLTGLTLHPLAANDSDDEQDGGDKEEMGPSMTDDTGPLIDQSATIDTNNHSEKSKPLKKKRRLDGVKSDGESKKNPPAESVCSESGTDAIGIT